MCGIFGVVALEREPSLPPIDCEAALRAIAHRGPDASHVHRTTGGVFGHTRLAVLDLTPLAEQPMVSVDGDVTIVFNGEIYNHHELRRELQQAGATFRSRSDTEVLLEGFRAWGPRIVERADGMFAIAVYDARRRELLLATDRAGKKPLYWTEQGGALWFASEIKALLAAGVTSAPDPTRLPQLVAFGYVPAPATMHRGISMLPPAHRMSAMPEARRPAQRYWRAPFDSPRARISTNDAVVETRRLFEAAVARRLEADVPLGAFLSGGIDSTLVVATMARLATSRVKTFSIGFSGDPRYDETEYAKLVAERFGTDHTVFTLEPTSFELVEKLVWHHDGPFGDASAIPTSVVSMLTRRHVTVALSGDGGDELFCGYPRFLAAEAGEVVPRPVRALVARALAGRASDGRSPLHRAMRLARNLSEALPDRIHRFTTFLDKDRERLFRPELRDRLDLEAPSRYTRDVFAEHSGAPAMARVLAHNFETYLPFDLLIKADRSSMAHSLEVRSPFLDTGLIEFAAKLPAHMLRRLRTTKWILKRAFADTLPAPLVNRRKMGFGMPLDTWFRTTLREYVHDMLGDDARLSEWFQPGYVRALLDAHDANEADHGLRLWLLLTIEVWLRKRSAWARRS